MIYSALVKQYCFIMFLILCHCWCSLGFSFARTSIIIHPTSRSSHGIISAQYRPLVLQIRYANKAWFLIRGGGNDDQLKLEATSEVSLDEVINESYNSTDNEQGILDTSSDISDPESNTDNVSTEKNSLQIQKSGYIRSALLCASLACDIALNKKKRAQIFLGSSILPTTTLAAGFLLASSANYYLSIHLEEEDQNLSSENAKRTSFFLFLFSLVNVITYFTTGVPFMGMGALAIHTHTLLVGLNGWFKGIATPNAALSVSIILQQVKEGSKNMLRNLFPSSSFDSCVLSIASVSALVQCFGLIQQLMIGATSRMNTMLTYAFLAKNILDLGVLSTLQILSVKERNQWSTILLNGVVSICSAAVAGATILESMVAKAALPPFSSIYFALALFCGFKSIDGLNKKMNERKPTLQT